MAPHMCWCANQLAPCSSVGLRNMKQPNMVIVLYHSTSGKSCTLVEDGTIIFAVMLTAAE
jgi:hypothetical protein